MRFRRIEKRARVDLAFLPGWGFTSSVVEDLDLPVDLVVPEGPLLPGGSRALARALRPGRPLILAGWSLGAYEALRLVRAGVVLPDLLVLISVRRSWPPHELAEVKSWILEDTEKGLKRFHSLAAFGAEAGIRRAMAPHFDAGRAAWTREDLLEGLEYLSKVELKGLGPLPTRALLAHGVEDRVAPLSEMPEGGEGSRMVILRGTGHLAVRSKALWTEVLRGRPPAHPRNAAGGSL